MKILFHHLAKTAGTSLIESFLRHFGERACPSRYDFELSRALMTSGDYDFYHGHFSFEKVREFCELNPGCFVFTFIRNPVNRVISQYHNWVDRGRTELEFRAIAQRGHAAPDFVKKQLQTFENEIFGRGLVEFLASSAPSAVDVYENHQVRYLSNTVAYRINRVDGLMQACSNLEQFYNFVGLTEWYDIAVRELNARLGLPTGTLATDVVMNTNESKKVNGAYVIDARAWDMIMEHNTLDMSLFMYGAGLFRSRYSVSSPLADAVKLPKVSASGRAAAAP